MESTFFKDVLSNEAANIIQENKDNSDFIILDIRTPMEFNMGRIPKAINIDMYSEDFADKLNALDKDKTYLIYCHTGSRSSYALNLLKQLGFKKIYHLARGIAEWNMSGKEIER
jgi:rhodanese-related sulfurtransferase